MSYNKNIMTKVLCVSGYPGSGKSTFCGIVGKHGFETVSMSEIIRCRFRESVQKSEYDKSKSAILGEWVDHQREKKGSDVIANWTADHIQKQIESRLVCVDGIRSDLEVFKNGFNKVYTVFVECSREKRLSRLQQRDRDGEGSFNMQDLVDRDETEKEWGLENMRIKADFTVSNEGSVDDLETKANTVMKKVVDQES